MDQTFTKSFLSDEDKRKDVGSLWREVNHLAIVVSDVGTSLAFYTDVVGMKQVNRPNFDRHGAWLSFGNVDLHLIKGRPAVHSDDDLIVSHIAIAVDDMSQLLKRLERLEVKSRKNISVPNPANGVGAIVDQAFVRDPDGYYIEFCNCASLDEYLKKPNEEEINWNLSKVCSLMKASLKLKKKAKESKEMLTWLYSKDSIINSEIQNEANEADNKKLSNLVMRRKIYGDITQNATEEELEQLLKRFNNNVPKVIFHLENLVRQRGFLTLIPPAFYNRDGILHQPPSFKMEITSK